MYWLLSLVFWFFMFNFYYFLGDVLLDFFGYEKDAGKRVIIGFLFTFFLTFIVVFPSQNLHLSWNIYFIFQCIVFGAILVFLILSEKKVIKDTYQNLNHNFTKRLRQFLRENWVLCIFVFLFLVFSISNQVSFYHMNYDDGYYIGKMVNSIGSTALDNENYYNGALLNSLHFDLARGINTYEISYAFFSKVFLIRPPFFCRVTMQLHNYVFFCIIYKELAKLMLKNEYAQYALLPFFLFLIAHGFLMYGTTNIHIRSFDLWQFQTAIFYGGSVVRTFSFPVLMIFSWPILQKFQWKQFLCMLLFFLSFLSFSSIAIPNIILFVVFIIAIKCFDSSYQFYKQKNKSKFIISCFLFALFILFVLATKKLDHLPLGDMVDKYAGCVQNFNAYYHEYYLNDVCWLYGFVPIILAFEYGKDCYQRYVPTFIFLFYLFFKTLYFKELAMYSAFNIFFVVLRTVSSLQYLLVFIFGVCIVQRIILLNKRKVWVNILSAFTIVSTLTYIQVNRAQMNTYDFLGSGMSRDGYYFKRVLDVNTTMTPRITNEIGAYFNALPYGNYRLYTPDLFPYDGTMMPDASFNIVSNRIQIHSRSGFGTMKENDVKKLNDFCIKSKHRSINEILPILEKYKTDYILVFTDQARNQLENEHQQLVLKSKETNNKYYLFKLRY